jgi:hypothetical protein
MFLLAHRWIRGLVLACMVFLAGTASCSCDSYDPDPYDDTPPVVTVEFNYVVPRRVNIRRPQNQNKRPIRVDLQSISRQLPFADVGALYESLVASPLLRGSPQWVIPLRR